MANHHPKSDLLMAYAAGSLGESWSLAVATHLALCPACRADVAAAERLGGSLLDEVAPQPVSADAWARLEARLPPQERPAPRSPAAPAASGPARIFPQPLRDYVGDGPENIAWKRLGGGARQCLIPTRDSATARLLLIPAGTPVPRHGHRGRELTLVLCGSFSDQEGAFAPGDLQDGDSDLVHQPMAGAGEDCICLAVTDAPLRFSALIPRLVQPFIKI